MVNNEYLIGTTEYLMQEMRYCINRCQLYLRMEDSKSKMSL
jgi:hypothetical protein